MKLKSIAIVNFRQFYGEQSIDFSVDQEANVTIIHGENGSGKTALLNAFKWAFYGTTDFETNEEVTLLSEHLIAESSLGAPMEVMVSVIFDHDGREYMAERNAMFTKQENNTATQIGKSKLLLTFRDLDGSSQTSPNPETHMSQILPARMHPYFFFNGERIEKLSALDASKDVQTAIKGMMGLEILERASTHLNNHVLKRFKKDLKDNSAKELSQVIEHESALADQRDVCEENIETCDQNRRHLQTMLSDINNELLRIGPIAEMQRERQDIETELVEIHAEISNLHDERLRTMSKSAFLLFTQEMNEKAFSLLEDRRSKGELPSKVKTQFLDDLLELRECICGRPLEPGHESAQCVESFKERAVADDVEDAFIRTSGALRAMKTAPTEFSNRMRDFNQRLDDRQDQKRKKNGRLDEIAGKVGASGDEDAEALEAKRDKIRTDISNTDQDLGKWKAKLEDAEKELSTVADKRRELAKLGDAERRASIKLETAEEVASILKALYESLSEKVRRELSDIVDSTFREIMKKDYWAEISPDYSLRIRKKVGDNVQEVLDKSTGEAQVTSLSFIGGLVSLARSRHGANSRYYKGGLFPIVMDSPYGNLDPEYRKKVAEAIPKLAEQVILLVSNSQWKNEVEKAVGLKTGKHYTLVYHTPHKKEDTVTSSVVGGSEYEYTELKEGYYE